MRLGEEDLSNSLHFKYLGVTQSGDGDPLTPAKNRITNTWTSIRNVTKMLTDTKLPRSLRLPLFGTSVTFPRLRIVEFSTQGMQKDCLNMFENVIKSNRKRDLR